MEDPFQILLFGDLTFDFVPGLQDLSTRKNNSLLTTFFEKVAFALRLELGNLSFHEREHEGTLKFITFVDLLSKVKESPDSHPATAKALICAHHFARFIDHYAAPGRTYPQASRTRIAGLCTGMLAAVAPGQETPSSWSAMVPGLTGEAAAACIEKYCDEKCLPSMSRPYVSAIAETGSTISGPPNALANLFEANVLPKKRKISIGVRAPYHAEHLYSDSDIEAILEQSPREILESSSGRIPVATSRSGEFLSATSYRDLVRESLVDILQKPLCLDLLAEGLTKSLPRGDPSCYKILPVATATSQIFLTAFAREGIVNVTVDKSMERSKQSMEPDVANGNIGQSKLAIVGFSGRFPEAKDSEAFWQILREGRDVASETPLTRWNIDTHVDPTGKKKNTSGTPYGCYLQDPGLFDARFFGMSPREAPQVDPAQRLALLTTYEAMENAGMVPDATPSTQRDRVGVFFGTTSNDWGETNSSQDIDTYYIPGSCRAFIPGRQNYFFRFSGPSYSVDTACSSSLAAMHIACNALLRGDIDVAISGGTNVMTNPDITAGLDRGHFLSRTGNCKTFDDGADGYCRGEGVCTVIIKRLEDAIADNDPVHAIILGAYTNHSAEAESITRPHVGAQKAIFERVLTFANVSPDSVGYVEMHGTGTQAGDAREMESVLSTFANPSKKPRDATQPLYLGSAKANVGHGESVSGIIALVKVLLMMEKNQIPPHVGIKDKINSGFPTDLEERNVRISKGITPWNRTEGQKRRAFINNFSAAGGNSSVLVEDAPESCKVVTPDGRTSHIVAISAKSTTALAKNAKALRSFINDKLPSLPDLSYTTTARRIHHHHRIMVTGTNLNEVSAQLDKAIASLQAGASKSVIPSVAFAFTGQGSQYLGMSRDLLAFSTYRRDLARYDSMAQTQGFPGFMPVISQTLGNIEVFEPVVIQLAITCTQMAMARLWQTWGVKPCAVIGHSLGEYAALNVAGVLSDADTIYLTGTRARLLQEKCTTDTHSMLAVGLGVNDIQTLLKGMSYEIACINATGETVLSGTNDEIDQVLDLLSAVNGCKKTRLRVPFAFHSSQVEAILDEFQDAARGVTFNTPRVPVLSPLLGTVVNKNGVFNSEYLARHCREAVNFVAAIESARGGLLNDNTAWIEIGPHHVVSGLLRTNLGSITVLPTLQRNKDTWKVLTSSLSTLHSAGAEIRWDQYHRDFTASLSVIQLPAYNWDLKNYWMQYVNDWSLYKGDAGFLQQPEAAPLSTTSVQRLVDEKIEGKMTTVVVESDLLREDLDPMVRGHRVNGVALCTPSVYADIALTVGDYLRRQDPKWANCLVDVQYMDVQKPLVAKPKGSGPQYLRCRVMLNTEGGKGAVEFYSVTPEGKKLTKHAECTITFPEIKTAISDVQEKAPTILKRMDELRGNLLTDSRVQKMHKNSSYLVVQSLASYDDEFKGVEECILDSRNLEAVSLVRFEKPDKKGVFHVNPHLIDNFGQPALFTMNANDTSDLAKEVFVNHGWTSLHFYKPVSMEKTYKSYVKMSGPDKEGTYTGDMTVFEREQVVAAFKGVKAQAVPRRLMDYIVSTRDDKQTAKADTSKVVSSQTPGINLNMADVPDSPADQASSWSEALNIISEESGVPIAELTGDTAFHELGVDSLLALLCASRFREELGLDHESTVFLDYPTVIELQEFWEKAEGAGPSGLKTVSGNDAVLRCMFHDDGEAGEEASDDGSSSNESTEETSTSVSSVDDSNPSSALSTKPSTPPQSVIRPTAAATSLLLQGNPSTPTTTKTLFLLPDGSGSASSYASLPRIHPSVAVIGVNCPYMKMPEQYTMPTDEVCDMYIDEIQRRQPRGPYALGGWSVGGIFAYHIAQRLVAANESVTDLILIDCPVPRGLDHLPTRYFEYCERIGLLGEVKNGVRKAPPPWLIKHFEACVDSLHSYYGTPLEPTYRAPRTQIIWASDAIDRHCNPKFDRQPDDPEGLKFLTEARVDFGPCGWETLLPEDRISISCATDANHFSMMKNENATRLSKLIEVALLEKRTGN
ncbi:hypothetical protein V493_07486 [Pseudogymnoascus sp. VKM F-4281 (FW-2241)]|nr:hypothetical protein V493_07486 [Pseudogymnoascus sp. VKM F-4281 (FW-2241)]